LLRDVLEPMNMSQNQLAGLLGVPPNRINAIIRGRRSITADTAVRLSRCLGTSAEFWLNLQLEFDLQTARDALKGVLEKQVRLIGTRPAASHE